MWAISAPTKERAREVVTEIVEARNQPRKGRMQTKEVETALTNAFSAFEDSRSALRNMRGPSRISPSLVNDLEYCYENARVDLRRAIREANAEHSGRISVCLLCGIDSATTLDHYLPSCRHPEYFIYVRNVVPACGRCNNRRGSIKWQATVNPYFDVIPADSAALRALISHDPTDSPPTVTFTTTATVFGQALQNHLSSLGLFDALSEIAEQQLDSWCWELADLQADLMTCADYFDRKRRGACGLRGVHYWETVLASAAVAQVRELAPYVERRAT